MEPSVVSSTEDVLLEVTIAVGIAPQWTQVTGPGEM